MRGLSTALSLLVATVSYEVFQMQKDETLASGDLLVAGVDYYIKLTDGSKTIARYMYKRELEGFGLNSRKTVRYCFINKSTGREIRLKSKQKILRPV